MNIFDPLQDTWQCPKKVKEWAEKCEPPIVDPWLAQININGSPSETLLIARLLFPCFIEYENGVFLEMQFNKDRYFEWKEKLSNVSEIEQTMNHIHVYDIFGYAEDVSEEEFVQVGQLIRRSWEIALSSTFPNYIFDVVFTNSDQDYGPTISFSKNR